MAETTLTPKDNGAYNRQIEAYAEGPKDPDTGRTIAPYNWFPDPALDDYYVYGSPSELAWTDVYHTLYDDPNEVIYQSVWITSTFFTFDVSGLTAADITDAVLEIDLSSIWVFVPWNDIDGNHTQTLTLTGDFIAGTDAQLPNFDQLATDKFAVWPYTNTAGEIDLASYLALPETYENNNPGTVQLPIADLGAAVDGMDWISFCFTFRDRPMHFYNGGQLYNDSVFVTLSNPVTGVRLVVNSLTDAVAFALRSGVIVGSRILAVPDYLLDDPVFARLVRATATFHPLLARPSPMGRGRVERDRRIQEHAARKMRGY